MKKLLASIMAAMMLFGGMSTVFASGDTKPNPDIGYIRDEAAEPTEDDEKLKNWYNSLTYEQKEYFEQRRFEEEEQNLTRRKEREKENNSMIEYLRNNLKEKCYSNIGRSYGSSYIEIGVPSARYIPKIDECIAKQNEKAKTSVYAEYYLCKYSLEELKKMKTDIENDSDFKKSVGKEYYYIGIEGAYIVIYFTYEQPEAFAEWLQNSIKYRDTIVVNEMTKLDF